MVSFSVACAPESILIQRLTIALALCFLFFLKKLSMTRLQYRSILSWGTNTALRKEYKPSALSDVGTRDVTISFQFIECLYVPVQQNPVRIQSVLQTLGISLSSRA